MYAESALGAGGPSAHVEVRLQPFLGHLRVQAESPQQTATSALIQTKQPIPHEQPRAQRLSQKSTSAGNVSEWHANDTATGDKDAKDCLRGTCSLSSCSAFGEEERLHGLGVPSAVLSLSTEEHCDPASGKEWNVIGGGSERDLPPVVMSGISGAREKPTGDGSTIQRIKKGREPGNVGGRGARRQCLVSDAYSSGLTGARDTSCNNGEIFHAYLNLGKRLPGRLHRDRDPASK